MGGFLERLGVELPVVQAGMGGGLSGAGLAAAVSDSGGLGTIGLLPPADLRAAIAEAREATQRPVAANLLLPFARRAHFEAASEADVVVTFWGKPRRRTAKVWIHQCGSVEEARAARAAGADAVIAQGVEAGGHVRGDEPALEILAETCAALGDDYPVLSAGGVASAADVRARIDAGAEAVVCGTRFLMTEESGAHPDYKARLAEADETILTDLFGLAWPARHRVIANAATRRWLRGGSKGPTWIGPVRNVTAPLITRLPPSFQRRLQAAQRPERPLFGPAAPTAADPDAFVDASPLYAGVCIDRITAIRPAGDVVRELSP